MFKKISLVLIAISLGGGGSDLPSYISRCSISDPNLNECLVRKANEAIPIMVKGDVAFNIPPLSPITFAQAPINGIDLKYIIYDAFTDDWNKFRLTEAQFDLKNGRANATAFLDRVEVTAQNYEIKEGKILDMTVTGQGKYNMTFVGFKIHYSGRVRLYSKGGDEYVDYYDTKANVSCERAYFYFENIQSSDNDDINAYIDKEWEKFFAQVKPAFDIYENAFYMYPMTAIFTAVPFNKIFLP